MKCFSDLLISVLFLREPVRLACEWFPDTSLHWVTLNMQTRLREERERMGEGGGGRSREPEREAGSTLLTLQGLALGALGYGVGAPVAGEVGTMEARVSLPFWRGPRFVRVPTPSGEAIFKLDAEGNVVCCTRCGSPGHATSCCPTLRNRPGGTAPRGSLGFMRRPGDAASG